MLKIQKINKFSNLELNHLWTIYNESFKKLNSLSPCKQSFDKKEFMEALKKETVFKFTPFYEKKIIGIGLITNEFSNLPWISKEYFKEKFYELFIQKKIFYFMGIAISKEHRRLGYSKLILREMFNYISDKESGDSCTLIGFDHSKKHNPFIPKLTKFINKKLKKHKIESQEYYTLTIKN